MIGFNLLEIYNIYFQPPYKVANGGLSSEGINYENLPQKQSVGQTIHGIDISYTNAHGREIFMPVELLVNDSLKIKIDCCTVRVTVKKTIIRTPLSERKGTVKEEFNIGDYVFTVKGVLIGQNRRFPDEKILTLKNIFESQKPVFMNNALAELFLEQSNRVAIESLEFADTEGVNIHHKPFSLVCESDFIEDLRVDKTAVK